MKSTWNFRVLVTEHKHADGEVEPWLALHEVYSDKNGNPHSYTENSVDISGNTKKELKWRIKKMKDCLGKPYLWGDDRFPQEYKK